MDTRDKELVAYLRERLRKLDGLYRDTWPRWTNRDYVAVSTLLRLVETMLATAQEGERT